MLILRWSTSLFFAALVTAGLFFFMQSLISSGAQIETTLEVVKIIDSTMPEIEQEVIEEIDRPQPLEQTPDTPPDVDNREFAVTAGAGLNVERATVALQSGLEIDAIQVSATDGDYLPLIRVPGQYPSRALQRGIEGWCLLEFTVDEFGNVVEDSIRVVDAEPPDMFDRASIRAVARFKYQPRVNNGQPVPVHNVQTVMRYNIDQN